MLRPKTGGGQVTAPIFLLVPQVKLPKRLDLVREAERAQEAVPGLFTHLAGSRTCFRRRRPPEAGAANRIASELEFRQVRRA